MCRPGKLRLSGLDMFKRGPVDKLDKGCCKKDDHREDSLI